MRVKNAHEKTNGMNIGRRNKTVSKIESACATRPLPNKTKRYERRAVQQDCRHSVCITLFVVGTASYRVALRRTQPPSSTMSKRQWNTVKERDLFSNLADLCTQELDDDDDDWYVSTDSSDDLDDLFAATINYGAYIATDLASDVDFSKAPLRVADLGDVECLDDFRFRKDGLEQLIALLRQPLATQLSYVEGSDDMVKVKNRYTVPFETGVLMILYRLARPMRVRSDLERKFSCRRSHCSAICQTFIGALYEIATPYLTNPAIFQDRFPMYAEKIAIKTGYAATNVWGFIDGTLKKTARPLYFQKAAYSGHKRVHGIKFQNVTTPDGYIAHLFGPIAGSRHDSYMLSESNLLQQLAQLMPEGQADTIYALYGDPAYPQSAYLIGGVAGAAAGSVEAKWNKAMSGGRIVVEWTFGEVGRQFRALDLKQSMMIFKLPVAKYYATAVFFINCRNCIYGGQTAKHFECEPMSLEKYLSSVDWN
jgi:nuclease HARBI1